MIIKSLSRKTASFGDLILYINQPGKKAAKPVFHNLKARKDDSKAIEKEFLKNFQYCPKRKNGVVLFHEILSFSDKDKDRLTPKIINDLVKKHLELRAPEALAYTKIHFDNESLHVHLIISGNLKNSAKKLRLSRSDFQKVKIDLERYQKEKYPELANSVVFRGERKKKGVQSRAERETERRKSKQNAKTQKQIVQETILNALAASYSKDQFIQNLENRGFEFYTRGKTRGVQKTLTGRKFRFKTLEVDRNYLESEKSWLRASARARDIKSLEFSKVKTLWEKMRFKEDILQAIQPEPEGRAGELQRLLKTKRQREREQLSKNFDREF